MSTFIDGIGASQNIDSSGEVIDIAGMDISTLAKTGTFTYEHELAKDQQGNPITVKIPSQVVGKILKAKKIFSDKDCADDREAYFWEKCRTPFLYVMGELFDDYKESAKDVAGMFRYDQDKRGQNENNVMNFSIEGAKLEKAGNVITKSIARKCTIAVFPCNHMAIAEMVPADNGKKKSDFDNLFKSENTVEIELIKAEDAGKYMKSLAKAETPHDKGSHLGQTTSGKDVHSHERIPNYVGFSSHDHKDAANMHYNAIKSGSDPKTVQHHMGKMKLHMQAQQSAEKRENRMKNLPPAKNPMMSAKIHTSVQRPYIDVKNKPMKKSMTAGSGNVAPGQLSGGAALAPQSLEKKMQKAEERVSSGPKGSPVDLKPGDKVQIKGMKHKATLKEHLTTASGTKKAVFHGPFGNDIHVNHEHLHTNFVTKLGKSEDLAKGEKGDWKKEGYKISHSKEQPESFTVNAHDKHGKKIGHLEVDRQSVVEGRNRPFAHTVNVHPDHQRKGIATAMHVHAEKIAGHKLVPHDVATNNADAMTKEGAKLWSQKEKPFGKSDFWLERAESEYKNWDKKDAFVSFMAEKMPNLTKSEIDAIGQTFALKKSLENEQALETLSKALKFGDGKPYAPSKEDATPKPLPKKFHDYKAQVKGQFDSEVEHVHPHYDGKSPDTVYLKSGHKLEGHEKGKYKAGDKVSVKQHMMGTHVMEHKKDESGPLSKAERHGSFHAEESHAKSVSDELHSKSKELGHTGSSYSFSIKGKGVHGSGFASKDSADKFAAHAKAHPAVHAVKQSEGHGHHFVDVHIKTPKELKKD